MAKRMTVVDLFCGAGGFSEGFRQKDHYAWRTTSKNAEWVLWKIYPYLIIKREQAKVGLKFRRTFGHTRSKPLSKKVMEERNRWFEEIKKLNQGEIEASAAPEPDLRIYGGCERYYYDLDAIREPHKTSSIQRAGKSGVVAFNLRVRDVKRGKKGLYAAGGKVKELKASEKEVEDYVYPEGLTKHDMAVRRFPRVNRKGGVGYTDPLHVKPYHAKGKNPGDFWEINTRPYPDAHFAVYPEEICIKPILSSCPEWVCKKCKKPRERIQKRTGEIVQQWGERKSKPWFKDKREMPQKVIKEGIYETVGWTDCGCNVGFEPGVVFDPFMGRGTTTKVARNNGRNSIGIEIQPSYLPIIKKYLEIDQQQQRLGVTYEIITGS